MQIITKQNPGAARAVAAFSKNTTKEVLAEAEASPAPADSVQIGRGSSKDEIESKIVDLKKSSMKHKALTCGIMALQVGTIAGLAALGMVGAPLVVGAGAVALAGGVGLSSLNKLNQLNKDVATLQFALKHDIPVEVKPGGEESLGSWATKKTVSWAAAAGGAFAGATAGSTGVGTYASAAALGHQGLNTSINLRLGSKTLNFPNLFPVKGDDSFIDGVKTTANTAIKLGFGAGGAAVGFAAAPVIGGIAGALTAKNLAERALQ